MHLPEFISWNWSPALWLIGALLMGVHLRWTDNKITAKSWLFLAGILLVEAALALPMGPAPGQPLFSLHMVRHIILLMLAPPLLTAGIPSKPAGRLMERASTRWLKPLLTHPFIAWMLGVGIMWFWHTPAVFNRMVTYAGPPRMHFIMESTEIISLIGIGFIFCSPIVFPIKKYRLPPLKGIIYLFTACSGCSILGILITFAAPGLYHTVFSSGTDLAWGLTARVDQQVGGLLMWVPGCFIYLSGVIVMLVRWFSESQPAPQSTQKQTATI